MSPVTQIKVQVGGKKKVFTGRKAWALHELIKAGNRGLTTLENPAPRWSHYIYLLRRDNFVIESQPEQHGGPFAGNHARYRLTSQVKLIEANRSDGMRRAA